ncbi:sorting and assembly machinery component 50 homolog [Oppia nitens]|uniref:sorting and assembly machinery component 50 homolog n=1 Tax=Oppia nitens TaxID=1686743 RepID=UPI0023DB19AB|nr:sorting and assembly machinery component 50 homolog [Oppia nitens]
MTGSSPPPPTSVSGGDPIAGGGHRDSVTKSSSADGRLQSSTGGGNGSSAAATNNLGVDLESYKTRVDAINIDGIGRTKDDILVPVVRQLFDADNFEQVVIRAHTVRQQLEQLGAFKTINVYIDTYRGAAGGGGDDHQSVGDGSGLEVTYSVVENRRVVGGVNTSVGNNNDGSLVLQLKCPNVFGRGELFQSEYEYGTKHTTGFQSQFVKPLVPWLWPQPRLTTTLFQNGFDAPWSGYRETDRGLSMDLSFKSRRSILHTVRWDAVWRDISALTTGTAFAVREECGHSLKSSLKHILTCDRRDNPIIPTAGLLFRLQQECAGLLAGNVGFHKHELELQYNQPLPLLRDIVVQASLRAGIMKPLQKLESVTCINDRFFIGGPLTLRGYQLNGVGPHSDGNALGANTYWTAGLHVYTPLPFRPGSGSGFGDYFRTHLFANAGNIGDFSFTDDQYKNIGLLLNRLRYSVGAGIVLSIGHMARFELNYCLPFGQQSGDQLTPGLQFGLGVSFI